MPVNTSFFQDLLYFSPVNIIKCLLPGYKAHAQFTDVCSDITFSIPITYLAPVLYYVIFPLKTAPPPPKGGIITSGLFCHKRKSLTFVPVFGNRLSRKSNLWLCLLLYYHTPSSASSHY
jgi:hypothetical protein